MAGGLEDRAVMSKDWDKNGLSPGLKFDLKNMWEGHTPHPRAAWGLCWDGVGAGNDGDGGVVGAGDAWDIYWPGVVEDAGSLDG
ncbi:unnamed protein product [Clonostachys byssicola]|uniref:Uncharacterized protein n=1 Tax=Clonostachys byssicola TaxID=160290 RepID=A0A9N9Y048_9HYPO|nr:unnamed protein product [Clonostachys byssicola]